MMYVSFATGMVAPCQNLTKLSDWTRNEEQQNPRIPTTRERISHQDVCTVFWKKSITDRLSFVPQGENVVGADYSLFR